MTVLLSHELDDLRANLLTHVSSGAVTTTTMLLAVSEHLRRFAALADNMEQELQFFRLVEAGKNGREAVNKLATDAMGSMLLETGKVIRPDFGGQK